MHVYTFIFICVFKYPKKYPVHKIYYFYYDL